ncbi:MAG TPA: polyhydroxyalkanoate synthesis regulator DNA-binding domain-containing protein [Candidatus Eremiobacteraceae bacterium]|nr:polyhydroxyalkanoate synthesis regulator DNA-binding domain-containing protein [Candidatus Eremiobacteraceae bacterium]
MPKAEVIIRKYSDRRLYDTSASRYVKLEDIASMVRDGLQVRVVDGRSGKDLTHLIFTQIIVENAREREIALPLQLLTELVKASDKATHEFLTWYLNNTLDLYKKAQEAVHNRLATAKTVVASPLEFVRNLLAGHSLQAQAPVAESAEITELRRQIKELQARLPRSGKKGRPESRRRRTNR